MYITYSTAYKYMDFGKKKSKITEEFKVGGGRG